MFLSEKDCEINEENLNVDEFYNWFFGWISPRPFYVCKINFWMMTEVEGRNFFGGRRIVECNLDEWKD